MIMYVPAGNPRSWNTYYHHSCYTYTRAETHCNLSSSQFASNAACHIANILVSVVPEAVESAFLVNAFVSVCSKEVALGLGRTSSKETHSYFQNHHWFSRKANHHERIIMSTNSIVISVLTISRRDGLSLT